jgi:UDP-glucuronate decarboxylase
MTAISRPLPADDLALVLDKAHDALLTLRGAKLFITGGSGFFGRWLLESLLLADKALDLKLSITVLTRQTERFAAENRHLFSTDTIQLWQGDVRTFPFPAGKFSHVIHAATTSAHETFQGEDPLNKFDTLVDGTRHVLDFAAQAEVKNFLFTSSGVAYGVQPADVDRLQEDSPYAPATNDVHSALGQAKRAAEFLCSHYADRHQWKLSIARCFSFVGPLLPLDIHYAIGNFIRDALTQPEVIVQGDGTPMRSYLYSADLIVWLLTIMAQGQPQGIYNVGSDQAISMGQLAHLVRDTLSPEKPVRILKQSNDSIGNSQRNQYLPDTDKAQQALGLGIFTPLASAIRKTADYALSIPTAS